MCSACSSVPSCRTSSAWDGLAFTTAYLQRTTTSLLRCNNRFPVPLSLSALLLAAVLPHSKPKDSTDALSSSTFSPHCMLNTLSALATSALMVKFGLSENSELLSGLLPVKTEEPSKEDEAEAAARPNEVDGRGGGLCAEPCMGDCTGDATSCVLAKSLANARVSLPASLWSNAKPSVPSAHASHAGSCSCSCCCCSEDDADADAAARDASLSSLPECRRW
mmetsp:Transcript_63481/g.127489  ORF Transcript_63481/g.127489 Transcript_63481/m.127489 type:complete len:221 (+) Transcript_63481:1255-1917(+)